MSFGTVVQNQIHPIMEWFEREPPLYIGQNDLWIRFWDRKKFYAQVHKRAFISRDGEHVPFQKDTWIFKQ